MTFRACNDFTAKEGEDFLATFTQYWLNARAIITPTANGIGLGVCTCK